MSHNSRLAYLLGEMRRQMNGAVVGSMRLYGSDYGLNYGVNIPTIRDIARCEAAQEADRAANHKFAKQLYSQEVRELRLAAFWFADAQSVVLSEWSRGIINSEVAEEAAFALMCRVANIEDWLKNAEQDNKEQCELLQYCALLAIAKRSNGVDFQCVSQLWPTIASLVDSSSHLLPKAVVALLEAAHRHGTPSDNIEQLLSQLPANLPATRYICDEMAWRI